MIENTYRNLSNIVQTDFELDRVIQTVAAVDPEITGQTKRKDRQTDRPTERKDRLTDRQTDIQTDKQRDHLPYLLAFARSTCTVGSCDNASDYAIKNERQRGRHESGSNVRERRTCETEIQTVTDRDSQTYTQRIFSECLLPHSRTYSHLSAQSRAKGKATISRGVEPAYHKVSRRRVADCTGARSYLVEGTVVRKLP